MGFLLPCIVISMQALIGAAAVGGARPPAMFVFGSSILDVGNNNYLQGAGVGRANSPYYGVDFPGSIPTGRFSNGYNIADYIAKNMGFACSPPPYLSLAQSSSDSGPRLAQTALTTGINYASGGAGILDSTYAGTTIPLSKEVEYFGTTKAKMVAAVGPNAVDQLMSRSIFLIGMGNNDLYVFADSERARNWSDAQQRRDAARLYPSLISNYSAAVTELYSLGARRFAIINVWQLGCVPELRLLSPTGACSDILNQVVAGFNKALGSLLVDLTTRLPGLVYSLADAFRFTTDILANPGASGFTDVTTTCCGGGRLGAEAACTGNSTLCINRDQHVFWDRRHPSQRTAFLMAQAFYDGPLKYTIPINFMQLAQSSYRDIIILSRDTSISL